MIRLRVKIYYGLVGAYGAFAVLGALLGVLKILVTSFGLGMFCLYFANKWLEEDAETLLQKIEGGKE